MHSLQHFVRRSQSLALYRALIRVARRAPPETRAALLAEIRRQFVANAAHADDHQHAFLLSQGRKKLADLDQMIDLSRS